MTLIISGIFLILMGIIGYYATTFNKRKIIKWYLIITLVINILGVIFFILLLIFGNRLMEA